MWITLRCARSGQLRLVNLNNVTSIVYENKKIVYNMINDRFTYNYTTQNEVDRHFDLVKANLKETTVVLPFHKDDDNHEQYLR